MKEAGEAKERKGEGEEEEEPRYHLNVRDASPSIPFFRVAE
jgi:hypothetical protein